MFENNSSIGTITHTLCIPRFIFGDFSRWEWKRSFFSSFDFNINMRSNPHIAIVGESGSGKSNLCKLILSKLSSKNVSFILLDPHNEYIECARALGAKAYDASLCGINLFELDGLTERERTGELTGMFKRIFHLGDVQSYILYKCIAYSYKIAQSKGKAPTLHDLLFTIKVFKRHSSSQELKVLEALEKRLLVVDGPSFATGESIERLISSKSIFALASLHTSEAQSLYIEGLLKKVYTSMLSFEKTNSVRLYLIIDEAEKLGESSVMSRLAAEGRKYGIGIIAISQRAKALGKELRSNSALFISFSQHEPEELNYISNLISGGNENNRFAQVKKAIRGLGKGMGIVLEHSKPKLVRFKLFSQAFIDPTHFIMMNARNAKSKQELYLELKARHFEFEEINQSLKELIKEGIIKYHVITTGPYSATYYITLPKNSAEHDVMVHLMSRHLKKLGINNTIHNSSYGPDVIAYHKSGRIALEYETGLQDFGQAKKMIEQRKSKFAKVIVVANSNSIERYRQIDGITLMDSSDFLSLQVLGL